MGRMINMENDVDRLTLRVAKLEAFMSAIEMEVREEDNQQSNEEEYDVDVDEDGPFITSVDNAEEKTSTK